MRRIASDGEYLTHNSATGERNIVVGGARVLLLTLISLSLFTAMNEQTYPNPGASSSSRESEKASMIRKTSLLRPRKCQLGRSYAGGVILAPGSHELGNDLQSSSVAVLEPSDLREERRWVGKHRALKAKIVKRWIKPEPSSPADMSSPLIRHVFARQDRPGFVGEYQSCSASISCVLVCRYAS